MNPRILVGGIVAVSAAAATFVVGHEGMKREVYADVGGVPTVCGGVVVKGVPIGTVYSKPQCDELTRQALEKHALGLAACTVDQGAKLSQREFDAFLSLAYNVGVDNVCASCLPGKECLGDLIRAGKTVEACNRILAYGRVRINGELRDCSDPKWGCRGVWVRRQDERKLCLGEAS